MTMDQRRNLVAACLLCLAVGVGVGYMIWGSGRSWPRYEMHGDHIAGYVLDRDTGDVWWVLRDQPRGLMRFGESPADGNRFERFSGGEGGGVEP